MCDDDATVRNILADSVSRMGFEADEAATVEDALKILGRPEIDYELVLVDKIFPDDPEGGYKILARISSMPLKTRRGVFVVFVSADIKTRDNSSAFLLGANTVVNKKDIQRLAGILEEDLRAYKKLYSTFKSCLQGSAGRYVQ